MECTEHDEHAASCTRSTEHDGKRDLLYLPKPINETQHAREANMYISRLIPYLFKPPSRVTTLRLAHTSLRSYHLVANFAAHHRQRPCLVAAASLTLLRSSAACPFPFSHRTPRPPSPTLRRLLPDLDTRHDPRPSTTRGFERRVFERVARATALQLPNCPSSVADPR